MIRSRREKQQKLKLCLILFTRKAVFFLCGIFLLQHNAFAELYYYLAPHGNDNNPGTRAKPFATIERARDAIRALDASARSERIVVELFGGTYELNRPVRFTADDSGTERYPIEYRAADNDELVNIVGSKTLSGWSSVTDPLILKQFDSTSQTKIVQVQLNNLGIYDLQGINSAEKFQSDPGIELFFCDQPMTLARYPNKEQGEMLIGDIYGIADKGKVDEPKQSNDGAFIYKESRPEKWANEKGIWLHGFWYRNWAGMRIPLGRIDIERQTISFPPKKDGYKIKKGQHFYAENILSELDSPGEWFIDRSTSTLYFWPPKSLSSCKAEVSVVRDLFKLNNVSNIIFRRLVIEAGRGNGFSVEGGSSVQIIACILRNLGNWGVKISGGTFHSVAGCDIYQTGQGGICLKGGDRKKLLSARHRADNNHIHHTARWDPVYQQGIALLGVGNFATHNLIENVPHIAIGFSGNEHTIEYNEIHSSVFQANDAGAIYTSPPGESWSMRGNKIRYNYLHNLYGFKKQGCNGVYLDDCFSSAEIFGNIFYKVATAIFIGGGRDNLLINNMFINCPRSFYIDARGLTWAKHIGKFATKELEGLKYKFLPWSETYPNLTKILNDNPLAPKGNIVSKNIRLRSGKGWIAPRATKYITVNENIVIKEHEDNLAFSSTIRQLSKHPLALSKGFKKIPFEKIGLYKGDERASWPVANSNSELKSVD